MSSLQWQHGDACTAQHCAMWMFPNGRAMSAWHQNATWLHHTWTQCCSQFWSAKGPVVDVYPTGRVTPAQFSLAGGAGVQKSPEELGHSLCGQL